MVAAGPAGAFFSPVLPETSSVTLTKKMSLVSYPKGAILFQKTLPVIALYIIVSGSVRILKASHAPTISNKDTLAYLNRGDVLGEMALLAGEPRSNTAVVDSTAELLVITKREFDALLGKKIRRWRSICRAFCRVGSRRSIAAAT